MAKTLYEKYGGFGQIHQVVMAFYDALLDDDDLGPFFDGVDMKALIDHQTKFISSLLGGPASFSDEHLRHAHASLDISPAQFDHMKTLLAETLSDHGVEDGDVALVLEAVEARRAPVIDT